MQSKILFQEKQRFTQWWLWLLLFSINVPLWIGIYKQLIQGVPYGDRPMFDLGLMVLTVFMLSFMVFAYTSNLKTKVTVSGIYFKLFPFHLNERFYDWRDVQKAEVVKYSPIGEYGGWGVRGFGGDKAFNVKGNQGLRILFKDGTKRLIGTQKPEELQKVIKELGFTSNQ